MSQRVVYLMRGLPSCGKSHTARRLAGQVGVVCETDEYFYAHVGEDPSRFDWSDDRLPQARQWNYDRFQTALRQGVSPVVVDRGNGLNVETQRYARCAVECGYRVELKEPDSPWWQEIRILLKYKHYTAPVRDAWAERLYRMNRATHRVPARRSVAGWSIGSGI